MCTKQSLRAGIFYCVTVYFWELVLIQKFLALQNSTCEVQGQLPSS